MTSMSVELITVISRNLPNAMSKLMSAYTDTNILSQSLHKCQGRLAAIDLRGPCIYIENVLTIV